MKFSSWFCKNTNNEYGLYFGNEYFLIFGAMVDYARNHARMKDYFWCYSNSITSKFKRSIAHPDPIVLLEGLINLLDDECPFCQAKNDAHHSAQCRDRLDSWRKRNKGVLV